MSEEKRRAIEIEIDRQKEMRTPSISKMISEGGLGADKYYDIHKVSPEEAEANKEKEDS